MRQRIRTTATAVSPCDAQTFAAMAVRLHPPAVAPTRPHRAARRPARGEESVTSLAMQLLERDLVPDFLIRRRIRSLLAARLREEDQLDPERQQQRLRALIDSLTRSPVAVETAAANQQHYEVPTE